MFWLQGSRKRAINPERLEEGRLGEVSGEMGRTDLRKI
jgi:hypothetical protein